MTPPLPEPVSAAVVRQRWEEKPSINPHSHRELNEDWKGQSWCALEGHRDRWGLQIVEISELRLMDGPE